jgi:hypothetical protein
MRFVFAIAALVPVLASAEPRTPVLVELFTSEGCSSCPPADAALAELARSQNVRGAEVIPLELHVDYWNSLGWADPFSAPEFTARQEAYAHAHGGDGLYTPQVVVDGTDSAVASGSNLRRAVEHAVRRPKATLELEVSDASPGIEVKVRVPTGISGRLAVALSEANLSSRVERGENSGRTLSHAPVARLLVDEGPTSPEHRVRLGISRSWRRERLRIVAFVQDEKGRVLAVGTASVPAPRS